MCVRQALYHCAISVARASKIRSHELGKYMLTQVKKPDYREYSLYLDQTAKLNNSTLIAQLGSSMT